jgi:hypothetical protein
MKTFILKSIVVLLLTLAFAFPASATETYRKSGGKSYVRGTNSAATSSSQGAAHNGAKSTANQRKHQNNSNKPQ